MEISIVKNKEFGLVVSKKLWAKRNSIIVAIPKDKKYVNIAKATLLTGIAMSYFLFTINKGDYGILVMSVLAFGLILPLSTLQIQKDGFVFTKYYFYGFLFKRIVLVKEKIINIIPIELELSDSSFQTTYNSLIDFFSFSSGPTVKIPLYEIKWTDKQDVVRRIKINEKQYFDIMKCMQFPQSCP